MKNSKKNLRQSSLATPVSMVKIPCLDYAFATNLELKASPVDGQKLQQIGQGERGKAKKNKIKILLSGRLLSDPKHFDFCAWPSKNVIKFDVSGKKGMPSCCNIMPF